MPRRAGTGDPREATGKGDGGLRAPCPQGWWPWRGGAGELRDPAAPFAQVFLLPATTSPALADPSVSGVPGAPSSCHGEGTVPPEPAHSLAAGFAYCKPHKKPWGKQKCSLQPLGNRSGRHSCSAAAVVLQSPGLPPGLSFGGGMLLDLVQSTSQALTLVTSTELTLVRDICEPPKGSSSQPRAANPRAALPAHSSSLGTGWGTRTEGPAASLLPQESQDHCHRTFAWLIAAFPPTVHSDPSLNTSQYPLVSSLGFALITSSVDP